LLRFWWLVTLVLAALGLIMGGAHLLELPVRMYYEPRLYMQVTSTLYRYYGLVGGPIQVIAFFSAAVLVWLVRARSAFRSTLVATLCIGLSLLLWFLLVQPVNVAWADALRSRPADAVQAYAQLRSRWEYGHLSAFVAWLAGFILLVRGVLQEVSGAPLPPNKAL
jgi:hypothetical protein